MKRFILFSLLAFAVCSCLLFAPFGAVRAAPMSAIVPAPTVCVPAPTTGKPAAPNAISFDRAVTLRVLTDGAVQEMSLQTYLLGVLPAEMPTGFPPEALKAQAVASRTFALKQAQAHKHLGADVCASAACCQGRQMPESLSDEQREHVLQALLQTDGLVLSYDNALIDATFFSCSGGKTESAVAVWGGDVPYLQAVDSPNEQAPYDMDSTTLSAAEFAEKFSAVYPQAEFSGDPQAWFSAFTYTDGGGIATVCIGGVTVRGTELRKLLQLRSTAAELSVTGDNLCFSTRGFGHRVGMSQYGARAMAEDGNEFDMILAHYYQGTALRRLFLEKSSAAAG